MTRLVRIVGFLLIIAGGLVLASYLILSDHPAPLRAARVQESLGLTEWQPEDDSQRQRGQDREV